MTHGMRHARLPVLGYLREFAQTHVHWVNDAIQPSYPLSPPSPPALNLQLQNQSFQWIFSGAFLKDGLVGSPCSPRDSQSLLQHHSQKASVHWCSVFFMVQPSHPYRTTGKTIAMTMWTFVGKGMSLVFNTLSVFVMGFPCGALVKNPSANARDDRDTGPIPVSGRCPGVGNGNPLQHACLEDPMDRGAWRATGHGVAQLWTWLSMPGHATQVCHVFSYIYLHWFLVIMMSFKKVY